MLDLKIPVDIYDQDLKKNKQDQSAKQDDISKVSHYPFNAFKKILGGSIHH